jgi:hypothetical protein
VGFLASIERTPVSVFVREDYYAYFVLLIFHAWGMAFFVGAGLAISLRVLGVAGGAPMERFAGFFPAMWLGAALAIPSGIGLLLGYPAKTLTNWIFPLKLAFLATAAWLVWRATRQAFPLAAQRQAIPAAAKAQAGAAIALFLAGVAAGKLLLYTYHILLTTD